MPPWGIAAPKASGHNRGAMAHTNPRGGPQGNPDIAPTGHFTAQVWVREDFPNAHLFDTSKGRRLFRAADTLLKVFGPVLPPLVRYHEEYLAIRHYAFEARLKDIKPDFVLEIGAGLSPRGITFAEAFPRLTYVEGDLAGMVEAKRSRIGTRRLPANYHLHVNDLFSPRFLESLPARPGPGQRVVVITEGVCDYLSIPEKKLAWTNIARFLKSAGGGTYLFELHPMERFARYQMAAKLFMALLGRVVVGGMDFSKRVFQRASEAFDLLRECGFSSARTLDLASLNTSPYRPPLEDCPWILCEAELRP